MNNVTYFLSPIDIEVLGHKHESFIFLEMMTQYNTITWWQKLNFSYSYSLTNDSDTNKNWKSVNDLKNSINTNKKFKEKDNMSLYWKIQCKWKDVVRHFTIS